MTSKKLSDRSLNTPIRDVSLFDQNELVRIWVIHHLEIIGEAARSIPQEFKNNHPWEVVEQDLPILKTSIDAILAGQE